MTQSLLRGRRLAVVLAALALCMAAFGLALAAPATGARAYAEEPAYAMVYSDGTMVFQRGKAADSSHGELVESFKDVESASKLSDTPETMYMGRWKYSASQVEKVVFKDPIRPETLKYWFANMQDLKTIEGIENLDTSRAKSMAFMFYYCKKLKSVDLSHFKTSKVTDMGYMFCYSGFEKLDCSSFDTARVTDMSSMFGDTYKLKSLNVTSFNTAKVKNFTCMFLGAKKLRTLDLSSFTVSKKAWASFFHGNYSYLSTLKKLVVSPSFKGKIQLSFELNKTKMKSVGAGPKLLVVSSAKAKSSNTKVATITKEGDATVKGIGVTKLKGSARSLTLNVVPSPTKISKLRSAKEAFTVTWKKSSAKYASGYEVRYSTSDTMKGAKTKAVNGAKKGSLKIAKLTAGETYYVQVRVVKKVSGKKYCSAWSAAKSVTVS